MFQWLSLSILLACIAGAPAFSFGQTANANTPTPSTPVAIENTNAAFSPVDVDVPQAEPGRPNVTLPAHIPPSGYLQFEQGFNEANQSPDGVARQAAYNQTIKIALDTRLLVEFFTQPYTYNVTSSANALVNTSNDPGDLILAVQGIIHKSVGALPTVALAYNRRVRAGTSANLDVGDYSQGGLLLMSGDLHGGFHYDFNAGAFEQNNGAVRRPQYQQSLAISHALFSKLVEDRLGGLAELSHFSQPFLDTDSHGRRLSHGNTLGLLFAASYAVRPNLVLDADFDHGLSSTSTQWQGGFGFTYLLPHRLWPDRHPQPVAVGPYVYRHPR